MLQVNNILFHNRPYVPYLTCTTDYRVEIIRISIYTSWKVSRRPNSWWKKSVPCWRLIRSSILWTVKTVICSSTLTRYRLNRHQSTFVPEVKRTAISPMSIIRLNTLFFSYCKSVWGGARNWCNAFDVFRAKKILRTVMKWSNRRTY